MQEHADVLYDAREWLTVILVVVFTYIADFDIVFVPWLGM
jgi:hypothetical protein